MPENSPALAHICQRTRRANMAALRIALLGLLFICSSLVEAEVEDLHPRLQKTEEDFQKAKTHVEHMLNLSPVPNEEKLHSLVKNESAHLACEMKKWAQKLHDTVATGEHQPQVKDAATASHTHLTEAAGTLEHVEGDLKQASSKYFAAAEKVLHEIKTNVEAKPCGKVTSVLKNALEGLKHDFDNYQFGMHELIGPHEGAPKDAEHHHGDGQNQEGHVSHDHHHHHKYREQGETCADSHSGEDSHSKEDSHSSEHSHHSH